MNKMDGLELLKRVKEKSPNTIGMIMTGYMEFREALNAIYPGYVYRFVKKPLDNNEVMKVVKMAITDYTEQRD
jgi:DNA-binding NtrC family response regulator